MKPKVKPGLIGAEAKGKVPVAEPSPDRFRASGRSLNLLWQLLKKNKK